jgi:hypothetical protein
LFRFGAHMLKGNQLCQSSLGGNITHNYLNLVFFLPILTSMSFWLQFKSLHSNLNDLQDEIEAAQTAAANQEIKRVLTEVLLKVVFFTLLFLTNCMVAAAQEI